VPHLAPSAIHLRAVTDGDRDLLVHLYGSTRATELALVDWSEDEKSAFVEMQFTAQDRYYREFYAGATFDVVEVDDEAVGRLYVARWPDEIRIVDVTILPGHRSHGIGTSLLLGLIDEAAATSRSLTIHVEVDNPARALYDRLGFQLLEDRGLHHLMVWRSGQSGEDGLVAHAAVVGTERDEEQAELLEGGVVDATDLLRDSAPGRLMEEQGERDSPAGPLPLVRRAVGREVARGEHELEASAVVGHGIEPRPDEVRERRVGQPLEHPVNRTRSSPRAADAAHPIWRSS
jgi:ribosomal protein S18 acetylase RimI-like enzyme